MKLLSTIVTDNIPKPDSDNYVVRKAVRAVLMDTEGRVPLLRVAKGGYHKLPGGGIKKGESPRKALDREVKEETGCTINVIAEVGMTHEYWIDEAQLQYSSCYLGQITSAQELPSFTKSEQEHGFDLEWTASLSEAIRIMAVDKPEGPEGKLIQRRDLLFLYHASQLEQIKLLSSPQP